MADARQELVNFLDRKAFDPVLHADARRFSDSEQDILRDVQERTEREKRRYHDDYGSASEIRRQFLDDVSSEAAASVNRELGRLGLPRLPELKDDFIALCERLGIS